MDLHVINISFFIYIFVSISFAQIMCEWVHKTVLPNVCNLLVCRASIPDWSGQNVIFTLLGREGGVDKVSRVSIYKLFEGFLNNI